MSWWRCKGNVCEDGRIVGDRWKCMVCYQYSLCDECYVAGSHTQHRLLKIKHPENYSEAEAESGDLRVFAEQPPAILLQKLEGYASNELKKLVAFAIGEMPLVRYLPAPVSDAPTEFNGPPTAEWLAKWEPSDVPCVCIASYNASCVICTEDFEAPRLVSADDGKASECDDLSEPLRQLSCKHVFHEDCVIEWLMTVEDRHTCPTCNDRMTYYAGNRADID